MASVPSTIRAGLSDAGRSTRISPEILGIGCFVTQTSLTHQGQIRRIYMTHNMIEPEDTNFDTELVRACKKAAANFIQKNIIFRSALAYLISISDHPFKDEAESDLGVNITTGPSKHIIGGIVAAGRRIADNAPSGSFEEMLDFAIASDAALEKKLEKDSYSAIAIAEKSCCFDMGTGRCKCENVCCIDENAAIAEWARIVRTWTAPTTQHFLLMIRHTMKLAIDLDRDLRPKDTPADFVPECEEFAKLCRGPKQEMRAHIAKLFRDKGRSLDPDVTKFHKELLDAEAIAAKHEVEEAIQKNRKEIGLEDAESEKEAGTGAPEKSADEKSS